MSATREDRQRHDLFILHALGGKVNGSKRIKKDRGVASKAPHGMGNMRRRRLVQPKIKLSLTIVGTLGDEKIATPLIKERIFFFCELRSVS
jgi:hypothetical protein